jgi:hypothetical protein
MSTLEEVFKNCNANHVFKKCKSEETGHDCIVMLEKPADYFLCNESRKSVINKNMAKFRCNGLVVVTIFDLVSRVTVNSIMHKTEILFLRTTFTHYEIGKFVKPDLFDIDLDKICTHGIHYFLTLDAALTYDIEAGVCYMDGRVFDYDGKKE